MHNYGYTSEVTNVMWTTHPELVQWDAKKHLEGAIRNDGREPQGDVKIVSVRGLTFCDVGVKQVSSGFLWVPAKYERTALTDRLEWRDECFCDPDFTVAWRVTYMLPGLDVQEMKLTGGIPVATFNKDLDEPYVIPHKVIKRGKHKQTKG